VPADGDPPLDLLPLEAPRRAPWPRDPQAPGAPAPQDAQPGPGDGRGADRRVLARPRGAGSEADRGPACPLRVGRDRGLAQRSLEGAAPSRAQHARPAAGARRRTPRALRATARPRARAARREQLLRAGVDLLRVRSPDEISVEHVARNAGISRGLLYHYFDDKDAFVLAVSSRPARTSAGLSAAVRTSLAANGSGLRSTPSSPTRNHTRPASARCLREPSRIARSRR
jgi:hypothetical protein